MAVVVGEVEKRRVTLSVAHGPRIPEHGNNSFNGRTEYAYSKAISGLVADVLRRRGLTVCFFDYGEDHPTASKNELLLGKKDYANGVDPEKDDLLVEIHLNDVNSRQGSCVLYAAGSEEGEDAARDVMSVLNARLKRGVHWSYDPKKPGVIPLPSHYREIKPTMLWRTVSISILIEVDASRFIEELMEPETMKNTAEVLAEAIDKAATIEPEDDPDGYE